MSTSCSLALAGNFRQDFREDGCCAHEKFISLSKCLRSTSTAQCSRHRLSSCREVTHGNRSFYEASKGNCLPNGSVENSVESSGAPARSDEMIFALHAMIDEDPGVSKRRLEVNWEVGGLFMKTNVTRATD